MPKLPLALPARSNVGRQPHAGVARLINCFAEPAGGDTKGQLQVWAAPGLAAAATLSGTGGVRAMLEVDGAVYAVAGRTLHQVDAAGGARTIGGIPSDGYVGIARNQRPSGVQTTIVCDGLAWVVVGGSLTRITDPDLAPPIDVCVINQSTIYAASDGRMMRSEINDATSIDGLDLAYSEASPDGLYRVIDRGGDLIAIGPRSVEIWTDTGGEAFGFSRQVAVRVGAVGPKAVTKASVITNDVVTDSVAWVATDKDGAYGGVVMLDGYTTRKISTLSEDIAIAAVADKVGIVASSWVDAAQGFIAFRLPTTTLVYNTTTRSWHDRQSRTSAGTATAWRVAAAAVLGGRVLVGDVDAPTLYWLDPSAQDEAGSEMVMTVRLPPLHAFPHDVEVNALHVDAVPGVGLATGASPNVDPVVTLRSSRDGETWSHGRSRALGRQGQRDARASWHRLGTFGQVTFELTCSAAVVRGFLAASWDGEAVPR